MLDAIVTPTSPVRAVAAPIVSAELCLNCDAPRMGEYCHGCGQHFLEGRLTVRKLILDFLMAVLSLQNGLLRTFWDLTTRPGATIRGYVQGRRQRYTNPVGYLLLSAAVYAFFSPLWKAGMVEQVRGDWGVGTAESEAFVRAMMVMEEHVVTSTIILCLIFVPLLRLLFRGRTNTAEAFVFSFFVFGHALLWQALLSPVAVLVSRDAYSTLSDWSSLILLGLLAFATGGHFGTRISVFLRMGVALAVTLFACVMIMLVVAAVFLAVLSAGVPQ